MPKATSVQNFKDVGRGLGNFFSWCPAFFQCPAFGHARRLRPEKLASRETLEKFPEKRLVPEATLPGSNHSLSDHDSTLRQVSTRLQRSGSFFRCSPRSGH